MVNIGKSGVFVRGWMADKLTLGGKPFTDINSFIFQVAACMTAVTIAPTTIWTEGLNWGISYDLPNDTAIFREYRKYLPKPMMQRRHRRDLYHKMEVIMDS